MVIDVRLRIAFCISLFFLVLQLDAQEFVVKGRVLDAANREPLAFVNILSGDGKAGAASDIDGKFILQHSQKVQELKLSYVGYEPATVFVNPSLSEQIIYLKAKETELGEIVIRPGINPADRIIRKVIENRFQNDHEHMRSFSYKTYEKITFGPENDSIPWDSISRFDTSAMQMKEFFDKQYLFMMESASERRFMFPDKNYQKVIASRVSGFADPLFVFLMSQLQSTSFYHEVIKIADIEYINPISTGSLSKYYFELQDTLVEPSPYDTTFIMTFRPLLNTNFDGLKGVISISTNNFAIRNVIAQPARVKSTMTIKVQQLYDFIQNEQWFPVQLNTDIIFQGAIGNGSVTVGVGSGAADPSKKDLVGRGKSYLSDIVLNPEFRKSQFNFIEVDVQPDAYRQSEEVWNKYRVDSLTIREINTYRVIDSMGKANDFDKLGRQMDALLNGKFSLGPVDLELDRILRINRHEGLRLGAGFQSNDRLSQRLQFGAYGAYGFKDRAFKFGGQFNILIDKFRDARIGISFHDDLQEAGITEPFTGKKELIDVSRFRQLLVNKMDHSVCQQLSAGTRLLKYAYLTASFQREWIVPAYDYQYTRFNHENIRITANEFRFTEATLGLRYAYGEKFIRNTRSIISLGTSHPVIWISYTRGFNGLSGGEYDYHRVNLKAQKTFSFKYLGKTSVVLQSGVVSSRMPYPGLFNALSDYSSFSFYSPNSFATMRMNEFAADRYAVVFLSHNFGNLLFRSKYFNPEPEIVTNIGYGYLTNPQDHEGLAIRGYEKGYFESGIVLNNMLNLGIVRLGIGGFYRYGNYAYPGWKDNATIKLSLGYVLDSQ